MRLKSAKTRLLVVDEPTSAMDPTGELHLFETLRSLRRGKTMVFVTHRFGHLTKHADLILWVQLASAGSAGFIHKRSRASADFFLRQVHAGRRARGVRDTQDPHAAQRRVQQIVRGAGKGVRRS